MSELSQLYQEVILDHSKRPRNFRVPDGAGHQAQGHNPLCGDRLSLGVVLDGDIIRDIGFEGAGCAISMASASLMTEALKGHSKAHASKLFAAFHNLVTGKTSEEDMDTDTLDKLAVFAGVSGYPMRVKCATLCWHTLKAALSGDQTGDPVEITTE